MPSTIREALVGDINQLAHLFDLYRIFYKKVSDHNAAREFLIERLQKKDSVIFVAVEAAELVGFTQLYPLFSSLAMKPAWILNDLYVLAEWRGRGVARQLLDKAKELARETGASGIQLETEKTNEQGNHLYPAAGFLPYDLNNFYWWPVG